MPIAPLFSLLLLSATSHAQDWGRAYEMGIAAARKEQWTEARKAFQNASRLKPGDISAPIDLPGPPTERRRWRNGSPYSPRFLAAYALYRTAQTEPTETKTKDLRDAASEWQTLLAAGQESRETYYFLNLTYEALGDSEARNTLANRFAANQLKVNWKVDTEVVAPEDLAQIYGTTVDTTAAATIQPGSASPNLAQPVLGRVPTLQNKYALIVGNSKQLSFAATDATRMGEALLANAGYDSANIVTITDADAGQILSAAKSLAARMTQEGTVLIYFAGQGVNIGEKDYLVGNDAASPSDTAHMVAKSALFQLFMARGARIFAFFETDRPAAGESYFGSEVPIVGAIAQCQATLPGDVVASTVVDGKTVGVYANAFVGVLQELRSNRIPILEFGWQIFYRVRRGDTGTTGGSSRQTPTLPVLTNLASDARF